MDVAEDGTIIGLGVQTVQRNGDPVMLNECAVDVKAERPLLQDRVNEFLGTEAE